MHSYSLITRKGILNLKGNQTDNQCAKVGHEVYQYIVRILFTESIRLNKNGWIMDHNLIDEAIQKIHVNSCEIMSNEILNEVEKVLKENDLSCIGIKLQIQPVFVIEENSAYFQEYRCNDTTDLSVIMNL